MRRKNDRRQFYLQVANIVALLATAYAIYDLRRLTSAIAEAASQKYELRSY